MGNLFILLFFAVTKVNTIPTEMGQNGVYLK